jgi:hypothetical protein
MVSFLTILKGETMFNFLDEVSRSRCQPIYEKIAKVLMFPKFVEEITSIENFWHCPHSGRMVYLALLTQAKANVKVMGWKRFKPWYRNTTAETRDNLIELNPKFFNRLDCEIANTLVHEWLHTAGFDHIWNNPNKHPIILKSVPYVVGGLIEKYYYDVDNFV